MADQQLSTAEAYRLAWRRATEEQMKLHEENDDLSRCPNGAACPFPGCVQVDPAPDLTTPDRASSIGSPPVPDADPVPNGGSRAIEGVDGHE